MAVSGYSSDQARSAWETLEILPIVQHPLSDDLPRVVDIALGLKRKSAYDAAYIALAQELGAVLWTLDRPLALNGQSAGLPVRLLD